MPRTDDAPAPSAEGRRLIMAHQDAWKAIGDWRPEAGNYSPRQYSAVDAASSLSAYIARLEAEVARLGKIAKAAEVPRGLYLALADAAPGIWHGGHRCDGAIRVGLPGERVSIGEDLPEADARAAAEAVNFVRRLDAAQRGRAAEGGEKDV